jgi:hypothetical protein
MDAVIRILTAQCATAVLMVWFYCVVSILGMICSWCDASSPTLSHAAVAVDQLGSSLIVVTSYVQSVTNSYRVWCVPNSRPPLLRSHGVDVRTRVTSLFYSPSLSATSLDNFEAAKVLPSQKRMFTVVRILRSAIGSHS